MSSGLTIVLEIKTFCRCTFQAYWYLSICHIHGRRWNPEQKTWDVPYTKLTLRFLEKHFDARLIQWNFTPSEDVPERLPEPEKTYPKPEKVIPAKYEAAVTALEQVLLLKRYSWRTIKNYKNCFRQFIRHYDDIKPSQIPANKSTNI
ncbi:MAG: hypothetical protein EPGJADBJ_03271 [Saprospiraceae bacterium]|nr:hypothetical protein [Saprospiraceae bacterium]